LISSGGLLQLGVDGFDLGLRLRRVVRLGATEGDQCRERTGSHHERDRVHTVFSAQVEGRTGNRLSARAAERKPRYNEPAPAREPPVSSDLNQLHAACSAAIGHVFTFLQQHRATGDDLAGDLSNEANVYLRNVVQRLVALYPAAEPLHAQPWFSGCAFACALDHALAFALSVDQIALHVRLLREENAEHGDLLALCYAAQTQPHELADFFDISQLQLRQRANAAWDALCALIRERTGTTWPLLFPVPPLLR
jgi:hypothetical protein